MKGMYIPEIINNFNAYKKGNRLFGIAGEVALPDLNSITVTVSGAGVLGEYETGVIGMYEAMQMEIPFRMLEEDVFSLMNPNEYLDLTLRGSQQYTRRDTAETGTLSMRIVVRGKMLSFKPGKLKAGEQMDASVSVGVLYLLIEIDGKIMFLLDKLNEKFEIMGIDVLEKIRNQC